MAEKKAESYIPDIISPAEVIKAQESAAIDIAVSTANKYPRSIDAFRDKLLAYGTADEETAAECFYAKPVGNGEIVRGPSVRLAELVVATYKNLQAAARIIAEDGKTVTAQGVCWDMESNSRVSIEASRSIVTKNGRRYSNAQVEVTKSAVCKIAYRNAVFSVVPMAIAKATIEEIKKVGKGDLITLPQRVTKMLEFFKKQDIPVKKILVLLKRKSTEDIDLDDLDTLRGIINAVDGGEGTYRESFAVEDKKAETILSGGKHETKKKPGKLEEKETVKPEPEKVAPENESPREYLDRIFKGKESEMLPAINKVLQANSMKPVEKVEDLTENDMILVSGDIAVLEDEKTLFDK